MKRYIEPITAIENVLTVESYMTSATADGEQIGDKPIGPGTGDGDAKEREEFDEFIEFMESQEENTGKTLW